MKYIGASTAYRYLVGLVALVSALAFCGDRALGWLGRELVYSSEMRFSRLYRGDLEADVLVLGNSRAVHMFLAPALEKRIGRRVRNLAWNGLSAQLSEALWLDWLDRHPPPDLVLIEDSFLIERNHRLGELRPFYPVSDRLSRLAREQSSRDYWGCRLSRLYCLNSQLTIRAAYYAWRSDQGWVNRDHISRRLIDATKALPVRNLARARPENLDALSRIIRSAESSGARVRLVHAPYLPAYRARLRNFDQWLTRVEGALGREIHDYSDALDDSACFIDRIHLNRTGSLALMDLLLVDGILDAPRGGPRAQRGSETDPRTTEHVE